MLSETLTFVTSMVRSIRCYQCVKSTQLSYLSKSKDTLIENHSSKSESHPVNYYLSKSLKVFGLKYQAEVGSLHTS